MSDDAAKIINDAATAFEVRENAKIEVQGIVRDMRTTHKLVRIVVMGVPPCQQYPNGANLYDMPRQVEAHKKRFPGAWVKQEISRWIKKRPTGMTPRGAVDPSTFLGDKKVHR